MNRVIRFENRVRDFFTGGSIFMIPVFVLVLFMVLAPMILLVLGSLSGGEEAVLTGKYSLSNYIQLLKDPRFLKSFANTFTVASTSTFFAVLMGVSLAWIVARTNVPFRKILGILIIAPFFLPSFIAAISWVILANPTTGLYNLILMKVFDLSKPVFNIYSIYGLIIVFSCQHAAVIYIFATGVLKNMDPALEESSRVLGAGFFKTARKITLALLAPSMLGAGILCFEETAGNFGVTATLGIPGKVKMVITDIYTYVNYFPPDYGYAAGYSIFLIAIASTLLWIQRRIVRKKSYVTVTGKGYRPATVDIGKWRYVAFSFCVIYILFATIFPYSILAIGSFMDKLELNFSLSNLTLKYWVEVLSFDTVRLAIRNSLVIAAGGGFLCLLLCIVLSFIVQRSSIKGKALLDYVSMLPIAIPGFILGVGILWLYMSLPVTIYGTLWILIIAFSTKRMPWGVQAVSANFRQVHKELEESSIILGGSWLRTLRKVTLPIMKPGLAAAYALLFIEFLKNLDLSILLYSDNSVVIPVIIYNFFNERGETQLTCCVAFLEVVILFTVLYITSKLIGGGIAEIGTTKQQVG
jgi:iron(III) transport system permease protein